MKFDIQTLCLFMISFNKVKKAQLYIDTNRLSLLLLYSVISTDKWKHILRLLSLFLKNRASNCRYIKVILYLATCSFRLNIQSKVVSVTVCDSYGMRNLLFRLFFFIIFNFFLYDILASIDTIIIQYRYLQFYNLITPKDHEDINKPIISYN